MTDRCALCHSEVGHPDEHPGLCCNCFDAKLGAPIPGYVYLGGDQIEPQELRGRRFWVSSKPSEEVRVRFERAGILESQREIVVEHWDATFQATEIKC